MSTQQLLQRIERRLERLEQLVTALTDDAISIEELSKKTGLPIGTIYTKTCRRNGNPPELPHFKKGKRLYFRQSEINEWMTRNRVMNREMIDGEVSRKRSRRGTL